MTKHKESAKRLIKKFEEVIKQEDLLAGKIKDHLYNREINDTPIRNLVLDMHELQSQKRKLHKDLRKLRKTIH